MFDDSDSDDDLFGSPSLKSSSAPTPSKQQQKPQPKKKSLFDDDDGDLFGRKDAPDVDLFGATATKPKFTNLFDDEPPDDDGLFGDSKSKSKTGSTVSSIFGDQKSSLFSEKKSESELIKESKKEPEKSVFKEPAKVDKPTEKKSISKGLFDDTEDSDLFSTVPKVSPTVNTASTLDKNSAKSNTSSGSKGLLDDTEDSNLFGSSTLSKNILEKNVVIEKLSDSLFVDSKEPTDLFSASKNQVEEKPSKPSTLFKDELKASTSDSIFENETVAAKSNSLFEDKTTTSKSDSLFADKPKASKANSLFADEPESSKTDSLFGDKLKTSKPKKLTTSIFDDSDDDEDLFSSSKKKNQPSSSLFEDNKSIEVTKAMEGEKNVEGTVVEKQPEEKVKDLPKATKKDLPTSPKIVKKVIDKNSIFDDDDDDDDLFGEKKKKSIVKDEPKEKIAKKDIDEVKKESSNENKIKTEVPKKPDLASKKAVFAEIQKKLEMHKLLDPERAPKLTRPDKPTKPEPSVVDGAVSSKKEPPKTLKLIDPAKPPSPTEDSPTNQQALKKPAVSGKIKNLQGKMGALKMLSPTDSPPTWRKSNEEKSSNDDEQEHTPELPSSDASTPTMPSGASSPHTSGKC